jgi:hypothetical protein
MQSNNFSLVFWKKAAQKLLIGDTQRKTLECIDNAISKYSHDETEQEQMLADLEALKKQSEDIGREIEGLQGKVALVKNELDKLSLHANKIKRQLSIDETEDIWALRSKFLEFDAFVNFPLRLSNKTYSLKISSVEGIGYRLEGNMGVLKKIGIRILLQHIEYFPAIGTTEGTIYIVKPPDRYLDVGENSTVLNLSFLKNTKGVDAGKSYVINLFGLHRSDIALEFSSSKNFKYARINSHD